MPAHLPPAIRVFISSTFADMENERTYFATVIAPRLTRLCADRGVSFFSVDLRWGITAEEQVNGEVLPICLREIDKCRPFFIGILGNRYGSVVDEITPEMSEQFPWLVGHEGKSITELEMLYGVLEYENNNNGQNCAFYFRTDELSDKFYPAATDDTAKEQLAQLKRSIIASGHTTADYDSVERFGEKVLSDFRRWLDKEFPADVDTRLVRRDWYNSELLRDYIARAEAESFLDLYTENGKRSLLIYGDGGRGKTTFLTDWTPKQGRKILVNCDSDHEFLYWPAIAHYIISEVQNIYPSCGMPEMDIPLTLTAFLLDAASVEADGNKRFDNIFYLTDDERESFRKGFSAWLRGLQPEEPLYIVINDLNLLKDDRSRYLSWLPSEPRGNVRIICTTNAEQMIESAKMLGWNTADMPVFSREQASDYVLNSLRNYGKNLSKAQLDNILRSRFAEFPGQLKSAVGFLIKFGRHCNLDEITARLGGLRDIGELYGYIVDYISADMTDGERVMLKTILGVLWNSALSLTESECFDVTSRILGKIDAISWATVRTVLEQLRVINSDYWDINDEELGKYAESLLSDAEQAAINNALGAHFSDLISDTEDLNVTHIRSNTEYAVSAIRHYVNAKNWAVLEQVLLDVRVMGLLVDLDWHYVRSAWMRIFISGTDIRPRLVELLKQLKADDRNKAVVEKAAALFADLEFTDMLEQAEKIIGYKPTKTLHTKSTAENIDEWTAREYDRICDLHDSGKYREAKTAIESLIADGKLDTTAFPSALAVKANAEMRLNEIENCLATCNRFYTEAVKEANIQDVITALMIRGQALEKSSRFKEAAAELERCGQLALDDGNMRTYLSVMNTLALSVARCSERDRAFALFDMCADCWQRLGNLHEQSAILMNKSIIYAEDDDHERAVNTAMLALDALRSLDGPLAEQSKLAIKCNIGNYYAVLRKTEEAEHILTEVIEQAEALGNESVLIKAWKNLARVYKDIGRIFDCVEICERMAQFHFNRKEYPEMVKCIKEELDFLYMGGYARTAQEKRAQWDVVLENIPGGKDALQRNSRFRGYDDLQTDRISEQIVVADSKRDHIKKAELLTELAYNYIESDLDKASETLLEAGELYAAQSDFKRSIDCAEIAVFWIMSDGVPRDGDLLSRARALLDDNGKKIVEIWTAIGGGEQNKDIGDRLDRILSYVESNTYMVGKCLCDLAAIIAARCDENAIKNILNNLQGYAVAHEFNEFIKSVFIKNAHADVEELRGNFTNSRADELLAYYEKGVSILQYIGAVDAATLSGNIAIIFRRRQNKEKTLYYHTLSRKLYEAQNRPRDCLIESMNLAWAYHQFGERETAISELYAALEIATRLKIRDVEASLAGNIASLSLERYDSRDPDNDEKAEILRLFKIEEDYFRDRNEYHDLAISLLNQMKFYMYFDKDTAVAVEKFEQADAIAKKYGFYELYQPLIIFRQTLASMAKGREFTVKDNPSKLLKSLFENWGLIVLEESEDDNSSSVTLGYNEDNPLRDMMDMKIGLTLSTDGAYQMRIVAAYAPRVCGDRMIMNMRQYEQWWNSIGDYALSFKENRILYGAFQYASADWDEFKRAVNRWWKLWNADVLNLTMVSMGALTFDEVKDIKTELMNKLSVEDL